MSRIVRRTRVAAWIARRRLAKLLDRALPAVPPKTTGRSSDAQWVRFPPF